MRAAKVSLIFRLPGNEAGTKLFYFLLCLLLKCNGGYRWELYGRNYLSGFFSTNRAEYILLIHTELKGLLHQSRISKASQFYF